MMRGAGKELMLPAFIGSAVLLIAFTLLTIVMRSPYTHSNLNTGYDPSYTRTNQIFVGSPIPISGESLVVTPASDPAMLGRQLFAAKGCADCHGLDGHGGIIGPSITGMTTAKLRSKTQVGPHGMPAYAPNALSDADLAAIAAFLNIK